MHRFKKGISVVMTAVLLCLLCSGLVPAAAAEYILDPAQAKGSDYTQSEQLAKALDAVFSGDMDIFTDAACSAEVSMPLGTSMNNSTQYYVKSKVTGNKISGWQCYIYANGVYNQLFREWVGHANGFAHSETVISGGSNTLSYDDLARAGVRCGAYLRTTGNSDGSYSSNVGHSMILLSYDQTSITYLEGNADGNGLVRITTRTWSDFNQRQLSGRGRYISHIAQPKKAFYENLYPICSHAQYDDLGNCSSCGQSFDWESTFHAGAAGQYQVVETVTPCLDAPYAAMTPASYTLHPGEILEVSGSCQNAFAEQWYVYTGDGGQRYFVPSDDLQFVEAVTLEVVCSDFSPADQAVLEQKAQPVKGTVTSNRPIKAIYAYLDGEQYAIWLASDQQTLTVNLRATDINQKLSFSTLSRGRHTITLKLQSFLYEDLITIHESVFYMVEKTSCTHSYQSVITRAPTCTVEGLRTYTCTLCADYFTEALPANGHQYENGICSVCGEAEQLILTGTVESFADAAVPTEVILRKGNTPVTNTTVSGLKGEYTFRNLTAGVYTLEIRKEGCVTWTLLLKLESGTVTQNAALCQWGDVTGDGLVNVADVARLYAHIRGTDLITEQYALQCADVGSNGAVNIADVAMLYTRIK